MKKKIVAIDGPWASGKSIVKCILDRHPELLACIHQEPILTAILENKIPLKSSNSRELEAYFLNKLKINELILHKQVGEIGWWFRKSDRITLPFKHNPKCISKKMNTIFHKSYFTNNNILDAYINGLKDSYPTQIKGNYITPILMEDFSLRLPLRLNEFKYDILSIIVARNPFLILGDLSNRKQGSYYLNYIAGFINGDFARVNIFYLLWFVHRSFYGDVLFVSFNNLAYPTNETIRRITDFLNINHAKELKKCTYHGEEIISTHGVRYMSEVCNKKGWSLALHLKTIFIVIFSALFTILTMPFFIARFVFSKN